MDTSSILLESPPTSNPNPNFPSSAFLNLQSLLSDSIAHFLAEANNKTTTNAAAADFSAFRAIFSRLLHSTPDPPLEAVWFFAALSFHDETTSSPPHDVTGRISAVQHLLKVLSAFSASSPAAKSIALLAPAVAHLHHCAAANQSTNHNKEIYSLLEAILSYISIRSGGNVSNVGEILLPGFGQLVKVWSVRHNGEEDGFKVVFPLVGDEVRDRLGRDGCSVRYLAGVVAAEAFLLRLCLKVKSGMGTPRTELQKELRIWAVSSITVFQNRDFFEILLRMLLEPPLPIMSLLNKEDETLTRGVLYDALILVDYSFVSGVELEHAGDSLLAIIISRLIVAHEAIQDARSKGDHAKAISYINAFATSTIPNYLIKSVTRQVGLDKLNRPSAATPQALLRWILDLEDKGLRILGEDISRLRKRWIFDDGRSVSDKTMLDSVDKRTDAELFFFDNQGGGAEEEAVDIDMVDNAFIAAAQSMKQMTNGGRKRKGGNEKASKAKFVKYKIQDSLVQDCFLPISQGTSSGSEVENPLSDHEMEESE